MTHHQGQAITIDEVTPEWLTDILYREQVLVSGRVISIVQQKNPAFNSHTLHLKPIYSADTTSGSQTVPARLLLKCSLDVEWARRAGAKEVAFYKTVHSLPDHPNVIVRCYDAACDIVEDGAIQDAYSTVGNSHILLDDLSDSYIIFAAPKAQTSFVDNLPTAQQLSQIIDVLARFHAYWWQNPRLGTGIAQIGAWCSDEAHVIAETKRRRRAWDALLENESDTLPATIIAIYESIFPQLLPLWQRYTQPRLATFEHLTLTHGDAYDTTSFVQTRTTHSIKPILLTGNAQKSIAAAAI